MQSSRDRHSDGLQFSSFLFYTDFGLPFPSFGQPYRFEEHGFYWIIVCPSLLLRFYQVYGVFRKRTYSNAFGRSVMQDWFSSVCHCYLGDAHAPNSIFCHGNGKFSASHTSTERMHTAGFSVSMEGYGVIPILRIISCLFSLPLAEL